MTEQNKGACCDVDITFTKMKTCETIITSCLENSHCNVNNQVPFHLVLMIF